MYTHKPFSVTPRSYSVSNMLNLFAYFMIILSTLLQKRFQQMRGEGRGCIKIMGPYPPVPVDSTNKNIF